jgi:hypothetical protein
MPRDPSKPSKTRSKFSKTRSQPPKSSKTQSQPPSWGWGPDGRYTPLTDDGKVPAHLPDHIELHLMNQQCELQNRYDELSRRVIRLAAKLRDLGVDPDFI